MRVEIEDSVVAPVYPLITSSPPFSIPLPQHPSPHHTFPYSVLSTEKKRMVLSRYRSRCNSLSETEITAVNKSHRAFSKTIPGKLDHASIAAVHLQHMNRLDNFGAMSTPGLLTYQSARSFGASLSRSAENGDGKSAPEKNVRRLSRTKAPNSDLVRYQYQRKF